MVWQTARHVGSGSRGGRTHSEQISSAPTQQADIDPTGWHFAFGPMLLKKEFAGLSTHD
jgi:hypothetical protein